MNVVTACIKTGFLLVISTSGSLPPTLNPLKQCMYVHTLNANNNIVVF